MRILLILYILIGVTVCGWFTTAAYRGWKSPSLMPKESAGGRSHYSGGPFIYGGGVADVGGIMGRGQITPVAIGRARSDRS